jgi:hypothetical protein
MQNLRCVLTVTGTGTVVLGISNMKSPVKELTRREMFKEITSKDTLKQVVSAWYGFSKPFSEEKAEHKKKNGLLQTIKKADMKYMNNNGKEG